jgi:hypothetical protein
MGLLETRLATLSDCVEGSQRRFAWALFPARAAKPEPLEPERGTCAWPPSRIDAYSSLIPATRQESSRTYRKYEVPNHVVTQNDWQPPRRVENPRPKSGRSPVRSRPWPPETLTIAYGVTAGGAHTISICASTCRTSFSCRAQAPTSARMAGRGSSGRAKIVGLVVSIVTAGTEAHMWRINTMWRRSLT